MSEEELPTAGVYVENEIEPYNSPIYFSEAEFNRNEHHDLDYFRDSERYVVTELVRRNDLPQAWKCSKCLEQFYWKGEGPGCPSCAANPDHVEKASTEQKSSEEVERPDYCPNCNSVEKFEHMDVETWFCNECGVYVEWLGYEWELVDLDNENAEWDVVKRQVKQGNAEGECSE